MIPIKEAQCLGEEYYSGENGAPQCFKRRIFTDSEVAPAETIVNSLQGMTIESAEILLDKVKLYLKQTKV